MRELSLHILDIIQNSIKAEASLIELKIIENSSNNSLKIIVNDNGKGIMKEKLEKVTDPFITSRRTREVGLGLSLLEAACKRCGGFFNVESISGKGTKVTAVFEHDHLDRAPLGNIKDTIVSLTAVNPDIDFNYYHQVNDNEFELDTRSLKKELQGIKINNPSVLNWLKNYISDSLQELYGGDQ